MPANENNEIIKWIHGIRLPYEISHLIESLFITAFWKKITADSRIGVKYFHLWFALKM